MKFLIAFQLGPQAERGVTETFNRWLPQCPPAVMFHGARIGTRSDVIFVVGESDEEDSIARVCQSWDEHGKYRIYPVSDAQ